MKAVQVHQFGAPEVLTVEEIPAPTPNAEQVLIRVHAAGVSPLDTYVREQRLNSILVLNKKYYL